MHGSKISKFEREKKLRDGMIYNGALHRDKTVRMRAGDCNSPLSADDASAASNVKLCVISLIAAACSVHTRYTQERGPRLEVSLGTRCQSSVGLCVTDQTEHLFSGVIL